MESFDALEDRVKELAESWAGSKNNGYLAFFIQTALWPNAERAATDLQMRLHDAISKCAGGWLAWRVEPTIEKRDDFSGDDKYFGYARLVYKLPHGEMPTFRSLEDAEYEGVVIDQADRS